MMRPTPALPVLAVRPPLLSTDNPRVRVFPSADGTVLLSGVTVAGRWVAEYRCLAEDFEPKCIAAMERRVIKKESEWGERRPALELVQPTR